MSSRESIFLNNADESILDSDDFDDEVVINSYVTLKILKNSNKVSRMEKSKPINGHTEISSKQN